MLIKQLNATHPEYSATNLAEYEALYEGGFEWHRNINEWIPQNAQEPEELWTERKKRACYDNHAGPIIDLIVAWLYSKPPTVDEFAPEWELNVDRKGTPLGAWTRRVVTAALQSKREFVWVNLPARPAEVVVTNRKDEIDAGLLEPFLVHLRASEVLDWGDDDFGNLSWALIRQEVEERTSVKQGRVKSYRWLWINATHIQKWTYTPDPKSSCTFPEDAVANEETPVEHKMGRLPVARIDLPGGLHVMGKVRDPAIRLTRVSNDLDWALHRGAHSLLVLAAADESAEPTLGAGYYLKVGKDDKVFFAEPGGAVYGALDKRITQAREEIYRVVQQMAAGISGESTQQANSAASKGMDWQSLQVMLAAYAELAITLIARVLEIAAVPLQVDAAKIKVAGLEGWQEDELAVILTNYLTAGPLVKSETFRRLLAKQAVRRMLPEDTDEETRDAIDAEIDAADYGEPEMFATAAPMRPGDVDDEKEDDEQVAA